MKILVLTPRLNLSGVPLAQIRLSKALKKYGHNVKLIAGVQDKSINDSHLSGVNVEIIKKNKVRNMLFFLVKKIRSEKPDLIFTAEDHLTVITLIAILITRSRAKLSGSSRVGADDLEAYGGKLFSQYWKSNFLKIIFKLVAWRADALTCVAKDMVPHYKKIFKNQKHTFCYNIIVDEESIARSKEAVSHKWIDKKNDALIVAAGRLDKEKGFKDLINAIWEVTKTRCVKLILIGDGPEKENLQLHINELGLKDSIDLVGFQSNPLKFFAHSDVFVLSSYAEGLPNVLVESMMCGCTPVATNCVTGPREVLQDGEYGYLVSLKNPKEMSKAIIAAIDNPISHQNLSIAIKPFETKNVLNRHFELLGLEERV